MQVYSHSNYREFIKDKARENRGQSGYKTRMAKAAGCQLSYLSQVLRGSANLTLEHAVGLSKLWELNEEETEIFF
jgi:transcriptional regulator with XRE-family HTH domain